MLILDNHFMKCDAFVSTLVLRLEVVVKLCPNFTIVVPVYIIVHIILTISNSKE